MAASCSLGTLNVKISTLHCGTSPRRPIAIGVLPLNSFSALTEKKSPQHPILRITSRKQLKVLSYSSDSTLEVDDCNDESKYLGCSTSELIPNFDEVESLLTTICDTTSIAEVELKVNGFRLHMLRNLDGKVNAEPPQRAEPIYSQTIVKSPDLNGSISTPSLAITKPQNSSNSIQTLVDKAVDEGLVVIKSPKVGFFRRCRTIKGKRAPVPCKEKETVKEGQVVCYVEQLGGELPIESDVSGEVIKILRADGDPIGYNDPLMSILPSFPGIKKLQ